MGHVKVVKVKIHYYLGMIMDFTLDGVLKIDINYYTKRTLEGFPYEIKATKKAPWTKKLLKLKKTPRISTKSKAV